MSPSSLRASGIASTRSRSIGTQRLRDRTRVRWRLARPYLERCGYVTHPLGWQNQDSTCEPASPTAVAP